MSREIRRVFLVLLGVLLSAMGALVIMVPVPLPPVGIFMLLAGFTLLTAHSRRARRGLQRARHRSQWLSRNMERFAERAPGYIRRTLRRTRPDAIARYGQIVALRIN
ncbi:MAG TPA: hypothetical protein VGF56_08470 [Rhizomicrobium sp.]|jgi:hypothetical protein